MRKTIVDHGGSVKEVVSYRTKNVSAKKYIVVSSTKSVEHKKPTADIQHAVRRGFAVVNSSYIFDTIERRQRLSPSQYTLELKSLKPKVTRDVAIARRHFTKSKTLKSMMKCKRQNPNSRTPKEPGHVAPKYSNPSVFYVAQKLRSSGHKMCQRDRRKLFRQHLCDWKNMNFHEKQNVSDAWKKMERPAI